MLFIYQMATTTFRPRNNNNAFPRSDTKLSITKMKKVETIEKTIIVWALLLYCFEKKHKANYNLS